MVPRVGGAVEVYSQSARTWLPATVLAVDGGDVHVRYTLADGSVREKWALSSSECREPPAAPPAGAAAGRAGPRSFVGRHTARDAGRRTASSPPPRRGAAASYVAPARSGTAPEPMRPHRLAAAVEPRAVGEPRVQVFSASAGRWVAASVVEADRATGECRVSYDVGGEKREKWVGAGDVRREPEARPDPPFAAAQVDKQAQMDVVPAQQSNVRLAVGSACQVFSASAAMWVTATLLELDNGEAVRQISVPTPFSCLFLRVDSSCCCCELLR
jgi:hypothetical protein